jgi:hypothetical protein
MIYVVNAQDIIATKRGTHFLAAVILSSLKSIDFLIKYKKVAAIIHHRTGEITHDAAILDIVGHETAQNHKAVIQAHITQPTIE